jgi:hypothetical protein
MEREDFYIPLFVILLSLLFAGISFAVYLTNGKSKKWVALKMKIGGLLLTLSAVSCNGGGEVSCYDTVATNSMWFDAQGEKGIKLNLDSNNLIFGRISAAQGSNFSFSLSDDQGKKVQSGLLLPVDGKFDAFDEAFKIEMDKNTTPGTYQLKLYAAAINSQDTIKPQTQIQLLVKNQ